VKKIFAIVMAFVLGAGLLTATTGCPGKDTKKTDTPKTTGGGDTGTGKGT